MGEVFAGRYELADPIGRGGAGAVWRAWDHRRRRYVAAKVLQQRDAHSLLRFVREQALRIDHPHVLAPASWAADDDKVLFTMDLVAGGSLAHLVGDYGPLPPAFVCTLLDQLLSGLAAVHAEDVVHRDVKPANVLLEATGTARPRLRLSDFGIAMRLGEPRLTETNLVVGTPGYLAPEQMLGAEPDFPADLFAVGLVALYLLEGAKPDAKALVEYFAAQGTPSAPSGIPEPLWQVVAMLLQPDPLARFRTATGARKALAAAAELLPERGPDDEVIEVFDQLGPLPPGFGPQGPLRPAPGVEVGPAADGALGAGDAWPESGTGAQAHAGASSDAWADPSDGPSAGAVTPPDPRHDTGPREDTDAREDTGSRHSTGPLHHDSRPPEPYAAPPQPYRAAPQAYAAPSGPAAAASQPSGSGQANMSDTGSFHLPPPQAFVAAPWTPATPRQEARHPAQAAQGGPRPTAASPHDGATHRLFSSGPRPPAPFPREASTASYTAPNAPAAPDLAQETMRRNHRAERRARRSGPPAKVAVPLLLLALACYAVGFWALTRV